MKKPSVEAFLLDIDGTLVNSNDLHTRAWIDAFAHFGKEFEYDAVRSQMGKGGDLLIPDMLTAREIRKFGQELKKYRAERFRSKYLPLVKPFPFVRESLKDLREQKIHLVLASSGDPEEVEHYIELLKIEDLIVASTSKKDARFSKPSPEIFEAALESVKAHQDRTFVVGDTPYDILAAHRCALPVIAVRSGGFPEVSLKKAELIFDDLEELVRKLEEVHEYFRN